MIDKEKIIAALKMCRIRYGSESCKDCPYSNDPRCIFQLHDDLLELLQEPVKPTNYFEKDEKCCRNYRKDGICTSLGCKCEEGYGEDCENYSPRVVNMLVDDDKHSVIEIMHYITETDLNAAQNKERVVDYEIDSMEKELRRDYPDFGEVFAYPKRSVMASEEAYKNALNKFEDICGTKMLKVILRAVKYKDVN